MVAPLKIWGPDLMMRVFHLITIVVAVFNGSATLLQFINSSVGQPCYEIVLMKIDGELKMERLGC